MKLYRASYKFKFVLTGSGSATSPRFCIGDGHTIGVATENNKNVSQLHTRGGRDAKGTVWELVRYRVLSPKSSGIFTRQFKVNLLGRRPTIWNVMRGRAKLLTTTRSTNILFAMPGLRTCGFYCTSTKWKIFPKRTMEVSTSNEYRPYEELFLFSSSPFLLIVGSLRQTQFFSSHLGHVFHILLSR